MNAALRPLSEMGEFAFTRRDFRRIAAMLHENAGIALNDSKAPLVYSRLAKRLRQTGIGSFKHYCELVESDAGAAERHNMIAALTTNVTKFFRETHHFEHLKTHVIPDLADTVRQGGRLRIWSAGCSSGEEAYSIALSLLEIMPDAPRFDVRILASDINAEVLEKAARGLYGETALEPVSLKQRRQWFVPVRQADGQRAWQAGEALKRLVAVRSLNLMGAWPMKQAYDAIFCRNVAIYFEPQAQKTLWRRMGTLLKAGGCLYVGHSERIAGLEGVYELDGLTAYRLKPEGETR